MGAPRHNFVIASVPLRLSLGFFVVRIQAFGRLFAVFLLFSVGIFVVAISKKGWRGGMHKIGSGLVLGIISVPRHLVICDV